MKQILLICLIGLPSLLLAQPTVLTFDPGDGDENVSTTDPLVIESTRRLYTTDGDALTSSNVDALIVLLDESDNPVPFDAVVTNFQRTITITPSAPLQELHEYRLTLQPVENSDHEVTVPPTITFRTGEFTPPSFSVAKGIRNSGSAFTFRVNVNEDATVHYVIDTSPTTPSRNDIFQGESEDDSPADEAGSFAVTANTDTDELITGLDFTPAEKYYIHYLAVDGAGNETNVTTTGLPLLISSSIPGSSIESEAFDLRVRVDEAVTTYFVVTTSSTQPTSEQIIAGVDENNDAPIAEGQFAVAANTDTDHTITGLDELTTYYVHFVSVDGAGNETIVETESETTADGTPPIVVSLSPADDAVLVDPTSSIVTITFDENVTTINSSAGGNPQRQVRLYEDGVLVETIDRNDTNIGTSGAIEADGTSPNATITFVHDFNGNKTYHILIGDEVFTDVAGNAFAGFSDNTDWNFETSGVTVNNLTSNICSGSFQAIGNIVISENGAGDFNNGSSQTLVLSLANTSEFVFSNSGVNVSGLSGDVTSLSLNVGLTSLTVTYTVSGNSVTDVITISGLKVYATGDVTSTTVIRTGGTADQDGNNGTNLESLTYATINVGASQPPVPELLPGQDLVHCEGEDITGKTLELDDLGAAVNYNWYRDASMTNLAVSTTDEVVDIVADLNLASPAVPGNHRFYVVAIDGCQSAPPYEVVIQVGVNPVIDAGADRIGANAVCPGAEIMLGGSPTLVEPSAPGPYTYSWNYVEGTPEPAPTSNPTYTVTNGSTIVNAQYNFELIVTDVNGCSGSDNVTIEVKPTFSVALISPNSITFTPSAPNQILEAVPAGGTFSGVGIVQSGSSPVTYQFSPAIAHATDPNTLPKSFDIYYTVTQNGCTRTNHHIATFNIANSFFATLQPQYCANEYPDPNVDGVELSLDEDAHDFVQNRVTNWNTTERFLRAPYNNPWLAAVSYSLGQYVNYSNNIYRCNAPMCDAPIPPDINGTWVHETNVLEVEFRGYMANYYDDYLGGNLSGPSVVEAPNSYTVHGETYKYYRFGTDLNYANCPNCSDAWPAVYMEFTRPEDVSLLLPSWSLTTYYDRGDLVNYNGNVYKCISPTNTIGTLPDANPGLWTNVTNADYGDGEIFHKWDPSTGTFRSGILVNGQNVTVNRIPTVFFNGLAHNQQVCEFDVLNLDNPNSSTGILYELTGSLSNQSLIQSFSVRLEGSATFDNGGGAIVNDAINPGKGSFDTMLAFKNSTSGANNLKNIQIRYTVDPGTDGSAGQPCLATSTITVQVRQNSTFDFDDDIVAPDQSVYCYTEPSQNLRAKFNNTIITGTAGLPNSVVYSGFGVNDLGNSLGNFRPGVAIDQISPTTTVQQSIPVTALYRDANQCRSTRTRTFKVTPNLQPSFAFGGRANYCYEDADNNFLGHVEDFTVSGNTVSSTGAYRFNYRDPANNTHSLDIVNSTNTTFVAQTLYDEIQNILTAGSFNAELNQTVNVNVIYTESLNAGKVCSETFEQTMVINPPIKLDIFGLTDGDILCRNDNTVVSQGHIVTFEGSVTAAGVYKLDDDTDFTAVNSTLNGTVNAVSGKATINLLSAYNAASDTDNSKQVFLQYEYTAPGCTGPANVVKGFEISPPPELAFDDDNPDGPFCYDAVPVELKTEQTTNVTLSGYGITDSGTGTGIGMFNPQLAFNTSVSNGGASNQKQNITVTAQIVDAIGCVNRASTVLVVNPVPETEVTFEETDFCYEDDPGLITSPLGKSWYRIEYLGITPGYTEDIGSLSSPMPSFSFNPKQRFDDATLIYGASALTPVNFNIYYFTADADNCVASVGPTLVSVANQIDVTIAGLEEDIYCSNENKGKKTLTFNPFPADASKRQFSINGTLTPLNSDKYVFEPGLAGGDYELGYVVFSGENNCSNTATRQVKVLPSPEAIFSAPPACEGAEIEYVAEGNNLPSAIYTWTFGDVEKMGQVTAHQFPATNIYGIELHVEYPPFINGSDSFVCKDSLRLDQTIGAVPQDLGFSVQNVCEGDATSFDTQPNIPISQFSWNFGDGISTSTGFSANTIDDVTATSGTYQAPSHQYAAQGPYTVVVTGTTASIFGACERTEVHDISILKNWSPTPAEPFYDMSALDGGRGYWVVEDQSGNGNWEFNPIAKQRIVSPEPAWVTGDTEPYNAEDDSYVNSPCFDLTSLTRPVFSLNHWTDTQSSDGAVVQYSIDGGKTWTRLGNVASGLEWYNRPSIPSNPGNQTDFAAGWSLADQRQWATGKHSLDVIPPGNRGQVRFRIAFKSGGTNGEARDGFAFNNVVIEERNRTILVENFTNEQEVSNNNEFKNFRTVNGVFNAAELVKLQYHHAIAQGPPPDDLHNANPQDQNARAAFYGVTTPTRAFIDGGFGQTSSNATFNSLNELQTYFSLRTLVTAPINIAIDFPDAGNPSDFNVQVSIQAVTNLGASGQYNVFIAVAEQSVDDQVYVLRKFLPTASGIPLTSLSPSDPTQVINVSYDMRHVTRQSDGSFAPFAVIAFVQHLKTKDVLQTVMRQDGVASPQIVTGIEAIDEKEVHMYPNPANDVLTLVLPSPVSNTAAIKVIDSFGREVLTDALETGQYVKSLLTGDLPAGVYLIRVITPEGTVQKKATVRHHHR